MGGDYQMKKDELLEDFKKKVKKWFKDGIDLNKYRKQLEVEFEIPEDELGDIYFNAMMDIGKDKVMENSVKDETFQNDFLYDMEEN